MRLWTASDESCDVTPPNGRKHHAGCIASRRNQKVWNLYAIGNPPFTTASGGTVLDYADDRRSTTHLRRGQPRCDGYRRTSRSGHILRPEGTHRQLRIGYRLMMHYMCLVIGASSRRFIAARCCAQ